MILIDYIPYLNLLIPAILVILFMGLYTLTNKINYLTMIPALVYWLYLYTKFLYHDLLGQVQLGEYQKDFRVLFFVVGMSILIYAASELYAVWIIRRSHKDNHNARMDA